MLTNAKTTRLEDLFEGFKNGNFGATIVYFLLLGILVGVGWKQQLPLSMNRSRTRSNSGIGLI